MSEPISIHLMLFVVDESRHTDIIEELHQALEDAYGHNGILEIVDVLSMPEKALENDVFATPMLVRKLPEPIKKLLMNIASAKDAFIALTDNESGDRVLM